MATDDSPFLSRWSLRKAQARVGAQAEAAPNAPAPTAAPAAALPALPGAPSEPAPLDPPALQPGSVEPEAAPALTLDDVALLTRESDYSGFVARSVTPDVRNAALKKLFTDPHFNVMDGLDTYIADYGQPDPLPEGMLRQMVQSQFLGLFADDPPSGTRPAPDAEAAAIPAAAAPSPTALPLPTPADEDADLQLQPDDAAGRTGAEAGPGQDAGRQH